MTAGRRRRLVIGAVVVALVAGLVAWFVVGRNGDPVTIDGALSYDEPDLVNPMRGQFDNIVTGLFPQSNDAQTAFDWPGTRDAAIRLTWRELEPEQGRYDFARLDQALDEYGDQGMRVALRVSTYDSCCEQLAPGERNIGVPDWLAERPGTVEEIDRDGVVQVVPRWNDEDYLDRFTELLAALGDRYDRDERLSIFEMSGYGDFGENVVSVMRDELGQPGPEPEASEAELGYYSQYRDQFIDAASVERLVTANLQAFTRTQVVAAPTNPEIIKQLLRDNPAVDDLEHPVGVRADCLGVLQVLPAWAIDRYSRYVETDDPIIDLLRERLRDAPVLTEWCQLPDDVSPDEYYQRGLDVVLDQHVSMTSSSGFPDQFAGTPMDADRYDVWRRANVYAGYRYAASVDTDGEVTWANLGVASTHERWDVVYELRDASGEVVGDHASSLDLRDLDTEQDPDRGEPVPATTTEALPLDVVGPGEYAVTVRVDWAEHKPDATRRVDYPPMALALANRADDGSYPIGTVTIE